MLTPAPGALRDVKTPEQIKARAEILAKLQGQIGLTAMAVGERDLALGLKELRRLAKTYGLKMVAANLVDAAGKPAFPAGFVTEVAGVKIGIFGLTEVPAGQAAAITEAGVKVLPPAPAALAEIKRLRAKGAKLVVALAHVGFAGARDLLTHVPGIDFAVVGHTSNVVQNPIRAGTGYFAEAQRQGKQLGELRLHVVPGQEGLVDAGRRKGYLALNARQHRDYERFSGLAKKETINTRREMYLVRLRDLRNGMVDSCRRAKEPDPPGGNWFEHTLVPMNRTVPDDPEIAAAVRAYKAAAPKTPAPLMTPPKGAAAAGPAKGAAAAGPAKVAAPLRPALPRKPAAPATP
jgi:hypothetical protein